MAGSYYSYEELRRHPNGIVATKTFIDTACAGLLIVEQSFRASGRGGALANCRGFSFFFELFIIGSELCFVALSYDLYVALHNPFVDYKANLRKYVTLTAAVAIIMASVLVGSGDQGAWGRWGSRHASEDPGMHTGPTHSGISAVYGLTNWGSCWVRPVYAPVSGYMWAFFYWVVVGAFAFSFFVLLYARRRLSKGLRETYEARMKSFMHGVTFVVGYAAFWLIVAIVYWISLTEDTAPTRTNAAWVFALFFSCRGVATLGVWLYNHNLREIAKQEAAARLAGGKLGKVNRQLHPHLNLALRREILHYTTLAIRLSIVQAVGEGRMREMVQRMKDQLRQSRAAMKAALAFASALKPPASPPAPALAPAPAAGAGEGDDTGSGRSTPGRRGPGIRAHLAAAYGLNGIKSGSPAPAPAPTPAPTPAPAPAPTAAAMALGGSVAHDPDVIIAAATKLAPVNDRHPEWSDDDLDLGWRPLDIALMAPLFERNGMFDLGEFTAKPTATLKRAGSEASQPGSGAAGGTGGSGGGGRGSAAAGAGSRGASNAAKVSEAVDPDSLMTPTSTTESGVIRRPPLHLQDLAPDVFARIRDLFGISPAQFFFSLSRTTKERFSEGASGAFMCFSHDMKFVIKTMEKDEADVLQRILPFYLQHLRDNPESLIIKFLACMSLRLYSQTMYFVVMENIFPTRATIHERFDLKGSWVGRSASKGTPGTLAYCRFCNESFKVGSSDYCKARPNRRHVANTVLKDNDLTFKLRLAADKAARLGAQLRQDAAFLAEMVRMPC